MKNYQKKEKKRREAQNDKAQIHGGERITLMRARQGE